MNRPNFSNPSHLYKLRSNVRRGREMTDDTFQSFLSYLYNQYFQDRTKWHDIFRQAAKHAVEGEKSSIYYDPDGAFNIYMNLMVQSTKDETLRQLRGLKVYHMLTATAIPMAWVIRIMKAYYPVGTLDVVRNVVPERGLMKMNQRGFVIAVR
jgi:hypothetical protein